MRVFKEEQRFTQPWIIILMVMSAIIPIGIILNESLKNDVKIGLSKLLPIILIIIFSCGIIFFFKLKTRIDEFGIHYHFFPFHLKTKKINWKEINKAYVRNYDPIGEYGGWGLKGGALWNRKNGKAINVSGDVGIQLELKSGKKLLIGTQKENEAKQVLNNYKEKINHE